MPGVHDGGRHGGVRAGVCLTGEAQRGQLVAEAADALGVEQGLGHLRPEVEALDEPAPRLVDVGGHVVLGEAAHHLGRLHEGVVGAQGLRGVARGAAHGQDAPEDALLTGDDRQPDPLGGVRGEPARLGDEVVHAHLVGHVFGEPLGAVAPESLLVGHADEQQVPLGTEPLDRQVADGDGHGRRQVEHVDRAAPPHLPVDELAPEGVVRPVLGVGRHHVGVAEQGQRGSVAAPPLDAGHHGGAPRERLVLLEVEAGPLEDRPQGVGVAPLVPGLRRAVVHAGVPDHLLEEFGRLAGQVAGHGPDPTVVAAGDGARAVPGSDRSRPADG